MRATDFCLWLQGFLEVAKPKSITQEQTTTIREHLQKVFNREIVAVQCNPTVAIQCSPGDGVNEVMEKMAEQMKEGPQIKVTPFDSGYPFDDRELFC